jgi:hypothetical protein
MEEIGFPEAALFVCIAWNTAIASLTSLRLLLSGARAVL